MKKIIILSILLLCTGGTVFAQSEEEVAMDALKAYKTKDADLLKKHAVGAFKYLINDKFFEKKESKEYIAAIEKWDGKLKEIRYQSDTSMSSALAYYADHPHEKDKIYAVALLSRDKKKWTLLSTGLITESREEFEKFSPDFDSSSKTQKAQAKPSGDFTVEMANGDKFKDVTEKKLKKGISSLDDDNFFLTLSSKEDFIQVSYSDKGYDIQYKENGKQYVARDYLTKEQTIDAFIDYYNGGEKWKKYTAWDLM
ncbi:MAG: hypothetical protein PVG39_09225 [Desulfobacteraceae bacterium]|jgi:hypothetical protein